MNLTNNVFIPEEGNTVYYVDPVYSETNWLKFVIQNAAKSWWIGYSITAFNISGKDLHKEIKDYNEHSYYVNATDSIHIEINGYSASAEVTFGGNTTRVAKNKSVTYNLSDYTQLFETLNGPIRIIGRT